MIRALLVTHGSLGEELLGACETILGSQSGVHALSNRDTSLESLVERIRDLIGTDDPKEDGASDHPLYLFVDLLGGSCGHAARMLIRERGNIVLFSGVNLPMVIEFLYYRGRVSRAELEERILKKGREGIQKL